MEEEDEIKARIQKIREKYARLQRTCSFGARVSPETAHAYAEEIQKLETQILTK